MEQDGRNRGGQMKEPRSYQGPIPFKELVPCRNCGSYRMRTIRTETILEAATINRKHVCNGCNMGFATYQAIPAVDLDAVTLDAAASEDEAKNKAGTPAK